MIYVTVPTTKERRPRLQKMIDSVRDSDYSNITLVVHEGTSPGYVQAMYRFIGGIEGLIFLMADDIVLAPDCISKLVEAFQKRFPDGWGCVYPFNPFQGERNIPMGLMPAKMFRQYWSQEYNHNFVDLEFTDLMKELNLCLYVPEAILEHNHPLKDKSLQDETYAKSQALFKKDLKTYNRRYFERTGRQAPPVQL